MAEEKLEKKVEVTEKLIDEVIDFYFNNRFMCYSFGIDYENRKEADRDSIREYLNTCYNFRGEK
jgi:hypothetical protein